MLRIKRLEIHNFGPFKGKQTIHFPDVDAVTIVYGENMRGKTILLNAIRYALFGKVLGRGAKEISLHVLSNWESYEEGDYGFKIILELSANGTEYELTRQFAPKASTKKPKKDRDYTEEIILRRDGNVLSTDDRDQELSRILPEQISRFFLFDGELLQEYEELVRHESEMGEKIKQSIEQILGVPIITNARADIRSQVNEASKKLSVAAQKDKETREIGNHISDLINRREFHEKEFERIQEELSEHKDQKNILQETLKRNERIRYLLSQKDEAEHRETGIDQEFDEKSEQIRKLINDSWMGLLQKKLVKKRLEYQDERDLLTNKLIESRSSIERVKALKKALKGKKCPLCSVDLDVHSLEHIQEEMGKISGDMIEGVDEERLKELSVRVANIQNFERQDPIDVLATLLDRVDELIVEKTSIHETIHGIDEQTSNFDQSEVRQIMSEFESINKVIALDEQALAEQKEKLGEINASLQKLEDRLKKIGGASLEGIQFRAKVSDDLLNLFGETVKAYRERLRKHIEADASKLFAQLTTEPDYSGLIINDNYGLTIIHKDKKEIPVRSAGAEHVVALSLMGALQRNAPIRGPIFMDSPFGRLDEMHTTKVIEALPMMANQVVLLAYESELDPQLAREHLLGKLKAEYKLERVSARHTEIVKMQ